LDFYRSGPYFLGLILLTIWCFVNFLFAIVQLAQFIRAFKLAVNSLPQWAMTFQICNHLAKIIFLTTSNRGLYIGPVEAALSALWYPFIVASTTLSLVFWRYVDEPGIPLQRRRRSLFVFLSAFFLANIGLCLAFALTRLVPILTVFIATQTVLWTILDLASLYLGLKKLWMLQRVGSTQSQLLVRTKTRWMIRIAIFDLCSKPFFAIAAYPPLFYSQFGWSLFLFGSLSCQCLAALSQFMFFQPQHKNSKNNEMTTRLVN